MFFFGSYRYVCFIVYSNTYYIITLDSPALRAYPAYEAVREEINRRLSPLSGGVDWAQIKTHCEWLAKGPGIDLLMAGYWTIASLKTQGLPGLANGVELINAIVSMLPEGIQRRPVVEKIF
ncbi:type VI secretion system ImpA family N-terminal domain-containing protein [Vibrio parahaemolyticus]|uniref:type VI secretion system ImpA family N-terminal domain-containing protein n=1 Tax=Vibrio parahaemolyticus TaxID=670 RepID=UPI001C59437A|nr:type VI secretion system ImpA family N-terminal domain-containing protein [Vibrio parahaemolyticus]